jgi:hypothetical protein
MVGQYEIELRLHALPDQAPGLRALVAERALRTGHDQDFIDAIELAVDELYAIVLANCDPAAVLTLGLSIDPERVEIDARIPLRAKPIVDDVRLRFLRALGDRLEHQVDRDATLWLSFRRSRPRQSSSSGRNASRS